MSLPINPDGKIHGYVVNCITVGVLCLCSAIWFSSFLADSLSNRSCVALAPAFLQSYRSRFWSQHGPSSKIQPSMQAITLAAAPQTRQVSTSMSPQGAYCWRTPVSIFEPRTSPHDIARVFSHPDQRRPSSYPCPSGRHHPHSVFAVRCKNNRVSAQV